MAGFEVTLYGRFWVTPEVHKIERPEWDRLGGGITSTVSFDSWDVPYCLSRARHEQVYRFGNEPNTTDNS